MRWLIERMTEFSEQPAVFSGGAISYEEMQNRILKAESHLKQSGIKAGQAVALHGEFSAEGIAHFWALALYGAIIVPLAPSTTAETADKLNIAACEWEILNGNNGAEILPIKNPPPRHAVAEKLAALKRCGLVLFSSGSTGKAKGMLRDFAGMVDEYQNRTARRQILLAGLLPDHIGGINIMLHALSSGGALALPTARDGEHAGMAIEKYGVDVLPTSPTFLNLMVLAGVHKRFDLSSLRLITYGTEPMPAELLSRCRKAFPQARFLQTFGTSETGIIHTSSRSSDSLEIQMGDDDHEYKIVDSELYLRGKSQVFGYLNDSPNSFTEDGWFRTGDMVEESDGGWLRIVGRKSDIINIGGNKVLPAEVESVLLSCAQVQDCTVYGVANSLTGQIVAADIVAAPNTDLAELKKELRRACLVKLGRYKAPAKFNFVDKTEYGIRFKKKRPRA